MSLWSESSYSAHSRFRESEGNGGHLYAMRYVKGIINYDTYQAIHRSRVRGEKKVTVRCYYCNSTEDRDRRGPFSQNALEEECIEYFSNRTFTAPNGEEVSYAARLESVWRNGRDLLMTFSWEESDMPPLADTLDIEKIKKECPRGFYDDDENYIPPDEIEEFFKEQDFTIEFTIGAAVEKKKKEIEEEIRKRNGGRNLLDLGDVLNLLPYKYREKMRRTGNVKEEMGDAIVEIVMRNLSEEMFLKRGKTFALKDFLKEIFPDITAEEWCEKHPPLYIKTVECPNCLRKLILDRPFIQEDWVGLTSQPCLCGNESPATLSIPRKSEISDLLESFGVDKDN